MNRISPIKKSKWNLLGFLTLALLLLSSLALAQDTTAPPQNDPALEKAHAAQAESASQPGASTQDAQEKSSQGSSSVVPRRRHYYRSPSLDERVARLAKALDLTDAQQAGVKKVLIRQQQEVASLRADQTPDLDRVTRLRAINVATSERIRALLNDDQKKKYGEGLVGSRPPNTSGKSVEDWLNLTRQKPKSN